MKTTVIISDPVITEAKQEAARRGLSVSALVEAAIRSYLRGEKQPKRKLRPLPQYQGGPFLVDIADRDALNEKLGGRW